MKVFSAPGYLIANARAEVKVVYTGFLAFTAVGLVTMLALQVGRIGFSLEGVATHYRGGDFGEEIRFARTFGELVEVTHFHVSPRHGHAVGRAHGDDQRSGLGWLGRVTRARACAPRKGKHDHRRDRGN